MNYEYIQTYGFLTKGVFTLGPLIRDSPVSKKQLSFTRGFMKRDSLKLIFYVCVNFFHFIMLLLKNTKKNNMSLRICISYLFVLVRKKPENPIKFLFQKESQKWLPKNMFVGKGGKTR